MSGSSAVSSASGSPSEWNTGELRLVDLPEDFPESGMRFLSTRTHGVLDYLVGALLILAPFIFGFADGGAAQWVPIVLGAGAIAYSLVTRYELGAVKLLPMPAHLGLDL